MELHEGEVVDRYTVVGEIAQGGMATIYKLHHPTLDSFFALKLLHITSRSITQRMMAEGRVQAQIRHPNVVAVTDVIDVNGHPGLVMEYIDGPPLDIFMRRGLIEVDDAVALFQSMLRGVAIAHSAGLVHRDLKPGNILLQQTEEGFVPKVTDFGLVKVLDDDGSDRPATRTGTGMGTPQYMAPEQVRDASRVDERADIFALGCMLYEMLVGSRAFDGPDNITIFNAVLAGKYVPACDANPRVPRPLSGVLDRMLANAPEARLASCADVGRALEGIGYPTPDVAVSIAPTTSQAPASTSGPLTQPSDARPTGSRLSNEVTAPAPMARASRPTSSPSTLAPIAAVGVISGATVLLLAGSIGLAGWWWTRPPAVEAERVSGRVTVEEAEPAPEAPAKAKTSKKSNKPGPKRKSKRITATLPPEAPEEAPAPAPAVVVTSRKATVKVTGEATKVVLVGSDGKEHAPGRLVAGTYEIRAAFGGRPVNAGSVTLKGGKTTTLACSSFAMQCRAQ